MTFLSAKILDILLTRISGKGFLKYGEKIKILSIFWKKELIFLKMKVEPASQEEISDFSRRIWRKFILRTILLCWKKDFHR